MFSELLLSFDTPTPTPPSVSAAGAKTWTGPGAELVGPPGRARFSDAIRETISPLRAIGAMGLGLWPKPGHPTPPPKFEQHHPCTNIRHARASSVAGERVG
jgi:hypothetical protein